jgi:hypothetical protein
LLAFYDCVHLVPTNKGHCLSCVVDEPVSQVVLIGHCEGESSERHDLEGVMTTLATGTLWEVMTECRIHFWSSFFKK